MTPRHPLVHDRPPPSCRAGAIFLLIVLACGTAPVAGADPAPPDSVTTRAGDDPVPVPNPPSPALRPPMDGVFRADRVAHASFALAIGTGVGLSSREPAIGAGTVIALAVAKELLDDRFDRGDLAAGAVGAGLAWLVVAALTR
jgi:hypothetical protein